MEDGDKVFSVDEAFLAVGFGKFQLLLLAYAGISSVAEAMEMMLLSFIGPAIHSKWGLSPHQESMLTSAVFVGMMVGALLWGIVSYSKGRR
jgi:MFS family permease